MQKSAESDNRLSGEDRGVSRIDMHQWYRDVTRGVNDIKDAVGRAGTTLDARRKKLRDENALLEVTIPKLYDECVSLLNKKEKGEMVDENQLRFLYEYCKGGKSRYEENLKELAFITEPIPDKFTGTSALLKITPLVEKPRLMRDYIQNKVRENELRELMQRAVVERAKIMMRMPLPGNGVGSIPEPEVYQLWVTNGALIKQIDEALRLIPWGDTLNNKDFADIINLPTGELRVFLNDPRFAELEESREDMRIAKNRIQMGENWLRMVGGAEINAPKEVERKPVKIENLAHTFKHMPIAIRDLCIKYAFDGSDDFVSGEGNERVEFSKIARPGTHDALRGGPVIKAIDDFFLKIQTTVPAEFPNVPQQEYPKGVIAYPIERILASAFNIYVKAKRRVAEQKQKQWQRANPQQQADMLLHFLQRQYDFEVLGKVSGV